MICQIDIINLQEWIVPVSFCTFYRVLLFLLFILTKELQFNNTLSGTEFKCFEHSQEIRLGWCHLFQYNFSIIVQLLK